MSDDSISRQEAIDLLDNLIGMVEDNHGSDYDAALRMGIEALKAEEPEDTIEMQESDIDEAMKLVRDARVTIPLSAEPVIRCAECIHWDRDGEEDVDGEKLCHFFSEGNEEFEFTVASDDYCSFAERRTDG